MTRLLLFIKHRLPLLWGVVEWLNTLLFKLFHRDRLLLQTQQCFAEFALDGYDFRPLRAEDIVDLLELIQRQAKARLVHFNPHGFDQRSLEKVFRNDAFLKFGVFTGMQLVGYFFLRCFWNRRSFVGRLIDEPYEGKGIGRVMNDIMYHTAWRSGFRCHTTISKDNSMVMRSHANNPSVRILKELPDNYLFIEFVEPGVSHGLSTANAAIKRSFDVIVSSMGLLLMTWLIAFVWLLASIDTRANGFFLQQRVGRDGQLFTAIKIRTMKASSESSSTVTTSSDSRVTTLGWLWRRTKVDELPQLLNVLIGKMSLVGPRPDVPGFADRLEGHDRVILLVRPGITGPATLKYRNEEELLASVDDPESYNRDVIYPDKVKLNREYVENWSFWRDIRYIFATILGWKAC